MAPAEPPDRRVTWFDSLGSTMDEARALALAGAPHGSVVAARVQQAGRGRGGRVWVSPPGNLHATVVLRPGGAMQQAPELGFVTGLAVAAAIDSVAGVRTRLKWPNDVLCGGAKLAGILMERLGTGAVLAGIGVNVAHAPPGVPYPVTCLAAEGCSADADTLLTAVLMRLDAEWAEWRTRGFAAVLARWAERGPACGERLLVRQGERRVAGAFAGLTAQGALRLATPDGVITIVAGDVLL